MTPPAKKGVGGGGGGGGMECDCCCEKEPNAHNMSFRAIRTKICPFADEMGPNTLIGK